MMLAARLAVEHVHEIRVERTRAEALLARLDKAFLSAADRKVENPRLGLTFVPYSTPYCVCSQCNSVVADWLRALGCRITWEGLFADFVIHPAN